MKVHLELSGLRASLTIDNPAKGNALTPDMLRSMASGLREADASGARVVVIRGGGGSCFSSGYDLSSLPAPGVDRSMSWEDRLPELTDLIRSFEEISIPVIAEINGHAIGGGALIALASDFRLVRAGARFRIPATKIGVLYPIEGICRLVSVVGLARAGDILMTGDDVLPEEGLRCGLYRAAFDDDEGLADACGQLATELASRAPLSVRGLRQIVRAMALPVEEPTLRALHHGWAMRCLESADVVEGVSAALQRRTPRFEGA